MPTSPRHANHPTRRRRPPRSSSPVLALGLPRLTVVRLDDGRLGWIEVVRLHRRVMLAGGAAVVLADTDTVTPIRYAAELAAAYVETHT